MPWITHQFLCYGLLKIFLKEAIDVHPNVKGMLCSYFLKTALFWEITTTSNQWNQSTLLSCFWKCFSRLLQWINCSYCPNFFIPQNNMFEGKIEGTNRDKLLQHLRNLYLEGYESLLRCQSLSGYMEPVMHRPHADLILEETSNIFIAENVLVECFGLQHSLYQKDLHAYVQGIVRCLLMYQLVFPTDMHQQFLIKLWLHQNMTELSMTDFSCESTEELCNRSKFKILKERINTLERCRTDSVCHHLYKAMLYHNAGSQNLALEEIGHSKDKISSTDSVYWNELSSQRYRQAGGEKFDDRKIS